MKSLFLHGYDGLGIYEFGKSDFGELFMYLMEKRKEQTKQGYPEKGEELLAEMENDPQLFLRRVCYTDSDNNIYARIPILAAIDPNTFVSSFLRQHPVHQRTIMMALKARYEGGALQRELAPEKSWLQAVHEKLTGDLSEMSKIAQWRVKLLANSIAPMLQEPR